MKLRNSADRFGAIAQILHWTVVVGIIVQYFVAEWAEEVEDGEASSAVDPIMLHRSIGLTILLLALLRLLWRAVDTRPAWPAAMSRFQRTAAISAHTLLYALVLAVPLSGWVLSSAKGDRITYFRWFDVPAITAPQANGAASTNAAAEAFVENDHSRASLPGGKADEESDVGEAFEEIHELLFNLLVLVAVLHALAALKHHFWDKDNVLRSMLPSTASRYPRQRD